MLVLWYGNTTNRETTEWAQHCYRSPLLCFLKNKKQTYYYFNYFLLFHPNSMRTTENSNTPLAFSCESFRLRVRWMLVKLAFRSFSLQILEQLVFCVFSLTEKIKFSKYSILCRASWIFQISDNCCYNLLLCCILRQSLNCLKLTIRSTFTTNTMTRCENVKLMKN